MKSNNNLVLLGMMGSGKSTIGHLLSKNLNIELNDVDEIIEKEEGCKISEIFEKKGEICFRKIEEKITLKLLGSNKKIISLGGGGFINDNIRSEVLSNHISFWLDWNNSTLINRIKRSKKRPITFNLTENQIKKIISERSKMYSMANFKINCEKFSKDEIVKKIKDIYEKN
ncbi:MAG: shikimate kinase [Candidatus Pelagibacter bacterium]|jgi:shikimate kinase|nr:shikimate kinase [Candidatus Pelagibacter sp.]MDP7541212.1 shikimate kinase [Candidatus Pelagibacter bacterium]|tara:strand:- start:1142 stop:1654 length:513 start_codon:yes stop_codon:yes gene_type:complete